MTIEVKQMLIKSSVVQSQESNISSREQRRALDEMRRNILTECREMIVEIMREEGER